MLRRFLLLIAIGLSLACLPRPSSATTLIHADTPTLVRSSSDIVVGRVQGQRSYWNDSHTAILTEVEVQVADVLKGSPGSVVTVTQVGGEVGPYRYEAVGSPAFRDGEDVLLFLWRDSHGVPQVNGLSQGKFEIRADRVGGERLVARPTPELEIDDARTLSRPLPGHAGARVTLREMLREIHRVLEEDGR
jgi:hypothetical protein